jgi:hypothetical protein
MQLAQQLQLPRSLAVVVGGKGPCGTVGIAPVE